MTEPGARDLSALRRKRFRAGLYSEYLAMLSLCLKGYVILAHRNRTAGGEIDIIARRGRRLAFIEVKRRPTVEEAVACLLPRQVQRIARSAEMWQGRRRSGDGLEPHIDLIAVAPGRWPLHVKDVASWREVASRPWHF